MPVKIVVGLRYGDEGKGRVVDWLCHKYKHMNPAVIRFNGGSQCAHNVVDDDGNAMTFHIVGSSLRKIGGYNQTYIGREVVFDPAVYLHDKLNFRNITKTYPTITLHRETLITTPIHVAASRIWSRKNFGMTTGMGVWETRKFAQDHPDLAIRAKDFREGYLLKRSFSSKVDALLEYFGLTLGEVYNEYYGLNHVNRSLYSELNQGMAYVIVEDELGFDYLLNSDRMLIFEGAQGVMLDAEHGHKPHVTSGDTTMKHALSMLRDYEGEIEKIGVTRIYDTRHGAGKFPTEDASLLDHIQEAHNAFGEYQGGWRTGYLNLEELAYAAKIAAPEGVDSLAVTHGDCFNKLPSKRMYGANGKVKTHRSLVSMIRQIENEVGVPVRYMSKGAKRSQMKELK